MKTPSDLLLNAFLGVALWVFYLIFTFTMGFQVIGRGYRDSVYVQTSKDIDLYIAMVFAPRVSVPLDEVIEYYGDPDYLMFTSDSTTDAGTTGLLLYWDSVKMFVELPPIADKTYPIHKKTGIERIIFYEDRDVYGIRIGETRLDQVIPILEQNGLSECQTEESASWIGITCGYSVIVQVDRATSIVNATGLYPTTPLSLGEIIEKYGEPNYVIRQAEGKTEVPTSRISLHWDSLRMTVEMPQIDSHIYALEGTTTAEIVFFLDDMQYIDSNQISFGEYYKQWNGYGAYQP